MLVDSFVTQKKTVIWFTPLEEDETVVVDDGSNGDELDGQDQVEEQPYLKINDRTVYKTPEDAIKGFNAAQERITSLSEYQKALEEFGAPKGADAQYLRGVIQEYLKLVEEREATKAASGKKPTASDEDKEFEGVAPQVVAQTKRGRQWLKENAEKVGLVSQDKYNKLEQDFNEFKNGFTQRDQEERNAAVEEGQQKITSWLGEAKVELQSDERMKLENMISAYVNSDKGLTNKWLKADRAGKVEIIKEGYSLFLPVVKPGASPFAKAANAAAAGKTKIGLVNRTKVLPQNGGTTDRHGAAKATPKIGGSELRNKAFAIMKQFEADQNG